MARKPERIELPQGTPDLIVLGALSAMGPLHADALSARLEQQGIKGSWQTTEHGREAKYYGITKTGSRALDRQTARWRRLVGLLDRPLLND